MCVLYKMELTSAFGILIIRHPDQCVRNCSLYESCEECSARLFETVLFDRLLAASESSNFTHVPISGRLILPSLAFVWAPCRPTKVFKLQERFLLASTPR